ncbi:MAG TPA: HEAT repeat domain-containing protein, partial [Pyrinomonadaceae bacterium]|nr:HEAT repeat domain-containing protein [Pyrinomonadaceae bacterium]
MKRLFALVILIGAMALSSVAHIPVATLVKIVKAEDERRFDATLETLMKNAKPRTRERAALAAGRIGNDAALPALTTLVERDLDINVRSMAMFAIGEIESIKSADFVTGILSNTKEQGDVRARAVEAAGKIAAANAKDPKSKELGTAIVEALRFEAGRRSMPDRDTIILGLTAALRVRPDGAAEVIAKFLGYSDERVRADAGNALARIRTRIATDELRKMLMSDSYSIARANAARALGAAEDKDSVGMLLDAALADPDPRVRVSAIGAVAALKDTSVVPKLVVRGNALMAEYRKSKFKNPSEKNELLTIASTLGRLMAGTSDNDAIEFIEALRTADKFTSPESEIAYARIDPGKYVGWVVDSPQEAFGPDWRSSSAVFQALGTIASLETNGKNSQVRTRAKLLLVSLIQGWIGGDG